jgi:hypothetical protein
MNYNELNRIINLFYLGLEYNDKDVIRYYLKLLKVKNYCAPECKNSNVTFFGYNSRKIFLIFDSAKDFLTFNSESIKIIFGTKSYMVMLWIIFLEKEFSIKFKSGNFQTSFDNTTCINDWHHKHMEKDYDKKAIGFSCRSYKLIENNETFS